MTRPAWAGFVKAAPACGDRGITYFPAGELDNLLATETANSEEE
jgi:hypothetical protein